MIVALRPLILETHQTQLTKISAALSQIADPDPATTLIFNAVILLAALSWLAARALGSPAIYRRTGLEWGLLLVSIGGAISCFYAGNKRVAINATVDWLCMPLATIVLVQLLQTKRRIMLTLCVILASASVQAFECFNQVVDTFPETRRLYERTKKEMWSTAGVEFDAPQVELFERRLMGNEATGFLVHSNVTGIYLVVAALIVLAAGWQQWVTRGQRGRAVAMFGLVAVMLAAAVLTKSRGAMLAGALGLALWLARNRFEGWFVRQGRRALILGWGAILLATVAAVGHGLYHKGLPGASLQFRWQYWTASARIFQDHPLTGVGAENFGSRYLRYKSIESPEEVSNPHNLFVQAMTQWGFLGGLGIVVMLVGGSIAATRPHRRDDLNADDDCSLLGWGLGIGGSAFLVRVFLLGSEQAAYLFYVTTLSLIVWAVAYTFLNWQTSRLAKLPNGLPRLAVGVNCALFAWLIQETINFATFVPGAGMTFFALLAIPVAIRTNEASARERPNIASPFRRWSGPVVVAALFVLHVAGLVSPVMHANQSLAIARAESTRAVPGSFQNQPAYRSFLAASDADPLNSSAPSECAAFLAAFAAISPLPKASLDRAVEMIDRALNRDPFNTSLYRRKMSIHRRAFEVTKELGHLDAAVAAARRVVERYPQSPAGQADLGRVLWSRASQLNDPTSMADAADHLQQSLDLDSARPEWEKLRRMPKRLRDSISELISIIAAAMESEGPDSSTTIGLQQ